MKNRKTLGLALGSGSAKGYAHIGFIQVLLENNIPIDFISGCSIGSLVGAAYATGYDIYKLEDLAEDVNIFKYFDIGLLDSGVVKGEKVYDFIAELTGGKTFEETIIPFNCVAVDVQSGTLKCFDSGSIADAVRASISIPAIFSPACVNGRYYVDGCVLERLPGKFARQLGADIVIGIDLEYRGEEVEVPDNMIEVLMQSMEIAKWEISKGKENNCDLVIVPEVSEFSEMFSKKSIGCIERGREAALQNLDKIKEALEI